METKNGYDYVHRLGKELGYAHYFVILFNGFSGELAIFWNDEMKCDFIRQPTLHLTYMYNTEGQSTYCLTYVYGNPVKKFRCKQWQAMINQAETSIFRNKPRVVMGDFNDIKSNMKKWGRPR